jgi:transposase
MNSKCANVTKNQIETLILPFIPTKQTWFFPKVDLTEVVQCILYKLKTGVQRSNIFVDIEPIKYPFPRQPVYCYYRKWSRAGVFKQMFEVYLFLQRDKPDTENLNLDGTHGYTKKSCESVGYLYRKKGKTGNVLIMTGGPVIPIAIGGIQSGNHNNLYGIISEFSGMIKSLNRCGIVLQNSVLNADKGFDCRKLRKARQEEIF